MEKFMEIYNVVGLEAQVKQTYGKTIREIEQEWNTFLSKHGTNENISASLPEYFREKVANYEYQENP